MPRHSRGVMLRGMNQGQKGRGGKAGGKAGKRSLGEGARKAIAEAHAHVEAGDHAAAAEAFAQLGEIASGRGKNAVAAFLALQGAQAQLGAGDVAAATEAARAGITHAEGVADKKRVGRFFGRFVKKLRETDTDAASALSTEVKERFGLKVLPVPGEGLAPNRAQRRALPKGCPGCGTKLDASSLRFEDDGTVDCPACGEPLS